MKAYLISDNIDTAVGMRLAGIKGTIVHQSDEILKSMIEASKNQEIGIILITEKAASVVRKEVDRLKLEMSKPLIVEIPDRHGTFKEKDRITRYIKEAIGVKI